jgi:hypothetical protein
MNNTGLFALTLAIAKASLSSLPGKQIQHLRDIRFYIFIDRETKL